MYQELALRLVDISFEETLDYREEESYSAADSLVARIHAKKLKKLSKHYGKLKYDANPQLAF